MKKILCVFAVLCISLSGYLRVNNNVSEGYETPKIVTYSDDIIALYSPVLNSWNTAQKENFGYDENSGDFNEYPYICNFASTEFRQDDLRYTFYDIDQNGIPELFIASYWDGDFSHLTDAYALKADEPIRIFENVEDNGFWSRNRLDFSQDGKSLIVTGSGGAALTAITFYKIANNGYQAEMIEGLTTYNPDNLEDLSWYHHFPDGTYSPMGFDNIQDKYYDKTFSDEFERPKYFTDFFGSLNWLSVLPTKPEQTSKFFDKSLGTKDFENEKENGEVPVQYTYDYSPPAFTRNDAGICIQYPLLKNVSSRINEILEDHAMSILDDISNYGDPGCEPLRHQVNVEYIIGRNDDIISVAFLNRTFWDGAVHAYGDFTAVNLDANTSEILKIADVCVVDDAFIEKFIASIEPWAFEFNYGEHDENDAQRIKARLLGEPDDFGRSSGYEWYMTDSQINIAIGAPGVGLGYYIVEIDL